MRHVREALLIALLTMARVTDSDVTRHRLRALADELMAEAAA